MAEKEKKKYKLTICMLEDGALEDYDDVVLTDGRYNRSDICKAINGSNIIIVKGRIAPSAFKL